MPLILRKIIPLFFKHPIILQVPKPCHENWQEMTPVEKGKFCKSCETTVTDFSIMSDEQVIDFIKSNAEKSCGRFRSEQLNRSLISAKEKQNRTPFKYLAASLFSLNVLAESPAKAQENDSLAYSAVDSSAAIKNDSCEMVKIDSCEVDSLNWSANKIKIHTVFPEGINWEEVQYTSVCGGFTSNPSQEQLAFIVFSNPIDSLKRFIDKIPAIKMANPFQKPLPSKSFYNFNLVFTLPKQLFFSIKKKVFDWVS